MEHSPALFGLKTARLGNVRHIFYCAIAVTMALPLHAYSVLTHEAIIDSAWDQNIKPLLLKRYPNATHEQLREAHAYAYGGCIIQDMGYYPFGSELFSDLLHYVRSGDFVVNQIEEAQSLDEYAFALGSLAHYAADTQGHSIAVNPSVGVQYPKLEHKYGHDVTYADDPNAHMSVEFGFDVLQVAHGNYAPQSYHDFIGFETAKDLLSRAFLKTYGIELKDVFFSLDLALGTYRHTVSTLIPEMTKVAWDLNKKDLMKDGLNVTRQRFVYNLSRASYEKNWGRVYQKPGIGARILAFLLRIFPRVGPLKAAKPMPPTPETAKWFQDSFNHTLSLYRSLLADQGRGQLHLQNMNFDTGEPTKPATYTLADDAYAQLAVKLADKDGAKADPKMIADIESYFRDRDLKYATKKDRKEWRKTVKALAKLKSSIPASVNGDSGR
jgi:hypothetical protein